MCWVGLWILLHTPANTLPSLKATDISPSTYRRESHRLFHTNGKNKTKNPASLTFFWLGWVSTKLSRPTDQPLPGSSASLGRWELGSWSHLNRKGPVRYPISCSKPLIRTWAPAFWKLHRGFKGKKSWTGKVSGGAQRELSLAKKNGPGRGKWNSRKCQVHSLTLPLLHPLTALSPESPNEELQPRGFFPKEWEGGRRQRIRHQRDHRPSLGALMEKATLGPGTSNLTDTQNYPWWQGRNTI